MTEIIVPTDLSDHIGIATPAERFRVITTADDIRAWWDEAARVRSSPEVG